MAADEASATQQAIDFFCLVSHTICLGIPHG